jgi:mRNA interferase MazF
MKRGEIYYIQRRDTIGCETAKARPAVIVSNDTLNATSEVVEVVYLTTAPKKEMPTHATIHATGVTSTAICEHIDHISKILVGNWLGTCTEEEMRDIEKALMCSLGIEAPPEHMAELKKVEESIDLDAWLVEIERLTEERDRYARMVDHLLGVGE